MSTSTEEILKLIRGGGDPAIELQDINAQTALARALKNRQVDPVMTSGRATLPNISGIVGNGADRRQATSDESRLMADRLRVQQAQTDRAASAIPGAIESLSGVPGHIDNLDGPPTPLGAQDSPEADEFNLLHGATYGAPAVEGQRTLQKYALQRAVEQSKLARTGGGKTTLLQLVDRNMQELGMNYEDAMTQALADLETYSVHEVAGGIRRIGNRRGGSGLSLPPTAGAPAPAAAPAAVAPMQPGAVSPLSTSAEEDAAARSRKSNEAAGTVAGTDSETHSVNAPLAKAMVEGLVGSTEKIAKRANDIRTDPALFGTTGWKNYIPTFRGSKAADMEAKIDSFTSAVGLAGLIQLKNLGGTLGQMALKESEYLQNEKASLRLTQSPEAFQQAMLDYVDEMKAAVNRIRRQYEQEYRGYSTVPVGMRTPEGQQPKQSAKERAAEMGGILNGG